MLPLLIEQILSKKLRTRPEGVVYLRRVEVVGLLCRNMPIRVYVEWELSDFYAEICRSEIK